MPIDNPLYIRLTSAYAGQEVTLSPVFSMHSSELLFQFSPEEQKEIEGYILQAAEERGLNPDMVEYGEPDWKGPVPIWAYYGTSRAGEPNILYNFNMASTQIITSMDMTSEEVVMDGETSKTVERIDAVKYYVVHSEDAIRKALDEGNSNLHSDAAWAAYQKRGFDEAKRRIDSNLDVISERVSALGETPSLAGLIKRGWCALSRKPA